MFGYKKLDKLLNSDDSSSYDDSDSEDEEFNDSKDEESKPKSKKNIPPPKSKSKPKPMFCHNHITSMVENNTELSQRFILIENESSLLLRELC